MPSPRINIEAKDSAYFLTYTVIEWIDIFTSVDYFQTILNTLKFYQKSLELKIFGYVVMTNHLHLLAQCRDMIKFTKGFKSYTTKEIKILVRSDHRKYISTLIRNSYSRRKGQEFQIWKNGNWPELIESEDFFNQKLDYIHENPVIRGYVEKEEDWLFSSARNYFLNDHTIIEVDTEGNLA